jgi:hypothetical protein
MQMNTNKSYPSPLTKKIAKGLKLSFKRLVLSKQKTNSTLAFSQNGKIVKIKARDITD